MKRLLTSVIALLAFIGSASADSSKELSFGILSTESSQNLKQDWAPILDDMSKRIGMPVKAFFAPDYAGVIEAMRFGKVQAAWLGNKPGIEAVDRANAEVFAQVVADGGVAGYWSLLIVHKDSPIQSLEDFKRDGKRLNFGLGDPNSTSGFLVPSYYLLTLNKIDPRADFKSVRNANHEANFLGVVNKQLDAAVVSSEILERFKQKNPEKLDAVRVVWRSPLIASDPIMWRKDLPDATKAKLKAFFLDYGKAPRERELLAKLVAEGFKESNDRQLIPFRQLALFKDKSKIEADTSLGAEDKSKKITEIDRKLAELNKQLAAIK
jgi:phosphonate transport system substrate-binding protein